MNPNIVDTGYGRTPLLWAADKGHERIVELLLERKDINPHTADSKYGRTPLVWAAAGGHSGIVKLLLEREGINPNTVRTQPGGTPLWWAAKGGHEGVVNMLLGREKLDLDIPGPSGQTALEVAASRGHVGVVKLLAQPKSSLPTPRETNDVLGCLGPERSDLFQHFALPLRVPQAYLPPSEPCPPAARAILATVILSAIICSLIFLLYFFALIDRSLLATASPLSSG